MSLFQLVPPVDPNQAFSNSPTSRCNPQFRASSFPYQGKKSKTRDNLNVPFRNRNWDCRWHDLISLTAAVIVTWERCSYIVASIRHPQTVKFSVSFHRVKDRVGIITPKRSFLVVLLYISSNQSVRQRLYRVGWWSLSHLWGFLSLTLFINLPFFWHIQDVTSSRSIADQSRASSDSSNSVLCDQSLHCCSAVLFTHKTWDEVGYRWLGLPARFGTSSKRRKDPPRKANQFLQLVLTPDYRLVVSHVPVYWLPVSWRSRVAEG